MSNFSVSRFTRSLGLALAGLCLSLSAALAEDEVKPTATLTLDQTEVSFLLSGKVGGGTLSFNGEQHRFSIGGLGVGGIGIASIEATGEVFYLENLEDFEGAYGQARSGLAVSGVGQMEGGIWLRNTSDVVIYLEPTREGVILSLGADVVAIDLDE